MPDGFKIASAWVEVEPSDEGFEEKLKAILDKASANAKVDARVDLDTSAFDAKLDDARARLDEFSGSRAEPSIHLNDENLSRSAEEARAKLDELDSRSARPDVGLSSGDLDARLDEARAKIDQLDAKRADPKLNLDDAEFNAKMDRAQERLDRFKAESASANLGASGGGGGGGGGEGGFLGGLLPGAGMSSIVAGATGLLPGIGGAGAGLGLMGGAGFLGLSGIAGAVSASNQASQYQGIPAAQQALTNFTNQTAIQGEQANLASVQRNAAESQIQALQGVKQAEQGVEEANYSLSQAQYGLSQAWETARENLRQLNDQLEDQKLSVQAAQLAVQQAEYQQKLVDQNAYSTALDRQQAALAVAQAQQQVKDSQDQLTAAQYKANQANKEGVAGSQTVIQAKQALIAAQYGQQNAQQQYGNAQRQLTLTEINNAQAIKQAQQAITNTLKEQRLQQAATAATANQAATQFQQDMAKLTPAARQVVEQILGMKGAFTGLEHAAQNGIAPGVSVFLKGISASMPAITSGVGKVAGLLGSAFGDIGKSLQSVGGAKILDGLISNGVRFAQIVIPAISRFAGIIAEVGSKKGAVDGIANALAGLADGVGAIFKGLEPFLGPLSSVFSILGKALAPIGDLLGTVVGSLASALAPALQAILPAVKILADSLGKGLAIALQAIGPMLQPVGEAITVLVQAFAPFLPVLGQIIGKIATALTPLFQALVPIIQQIAGLMAKDLQNGFLAVLQAILPILPVAVNLIDSLLPVVSMVLKLAGVLMDLQAKITGPIISAIAWLVKEILDLASHWQVAFDAIETAALWLWHNVLDPMWGALTAGVKLFVQGFGLAWGQLETVFKTPVNFLISTVYDKGIAGLWNDVVVALGQQSLKLPIISTFATGGPVTGGTPGQDSVPALLMPGERVLSVPQVAQLGGQGGIDRLVGAAQPTYHNGVVHAGGGWSWNPITDIEHVISGGWDLAKIAAAVATGNTTALSNALDKMVGTNAVGSFGKMMLGIPTKLIHTLVQAIGGMFSGGGSGGGGGGAIPTGQHLSIIDQALAAAGVPPPGTRAQWEAGLNTLIGRESGWNPRAINLTDINAQNGDPSRGLAQTIMSTFLAYHVPGTSMDIFDPVANVAAAIKYIVADYGNISNVQQANAGLPPKGYDSGGVAYGLGMLPKYTPRPERVLSPRQTEAFERLVAAQERQSRPGAGGGGAQVVQNYYGPQMPNPEQAAAMRRDLALALSG